MDNSSPIQGTLVPAYGVSRRQWIATVLAWLVLVAVFSVLYRTSRGTIMREIRQQVMGVAIAVAAGINPEHITAIRSEADAALPAYVSVQNYLTNVSLANPDVRYIYTMRRSGKPGALPSDYEYVVDERAMDRDANGLVSKDEQSVPPGVPYDASALPEMVAAWMRPSADHEVTPDPPYPDLISGYAPVKDAAGNTVAIVGVDMTAATIRGKMLAIRIALFAAFVIIASLVSWALHLLTRTRHALAHVQALSRELEERNGMLRSANQELMRLNQVYEDELRLAQSVQRGFLPQSFPHHRNLHFDQCFITCAMLGGDLYDAFTIDEHHVGIYVADVSGHGASAALISGLLKMAMESIKGGRSVLSGTVGAGLAAHPALVLKELNQLLRTEMPSDKFVTVIYAVFNLLDHTCQIASAGHPPPVLYDSAMKRPEFCAIRNGPAVGILKEANYHDSLVPVRTGDKLIFYTDGLTEAMNGNREEYGEKRFIELIARLGGEGGCVNWADSITEAVAQFRGNCEMSDDFTLLVADFRTEAAGVDTQAG